MSVWAELLAKLRSLIRRILGAVGVEGSAGDAIYVRAVPDVVKVSEHYEFEQEISRNPSRDWKDEPSGKVEITVPYDGADHFGAQARADVEEALGGPWSGRRPKDVRIGHLLFDGYAGSDLGSRLDLAGRNGAMELRIPLPDDADLGADRLTCAIRHDYRPDRAKLKQYPVDVQIDLLDPDNAGLAAVDLLNAPDPVIIRAMPGMLERHVSFRPFLQLRVTVLVHLPKPPPGVVLQPKVSKVSLDWPTITSLRGLQLTKGSEGHENDEAAVWYNPLTRSIEWDDVRMTRDAEEEDEDVHTYRSLDMNLWINQPGELYMQSILEGHVEVEIPGYLLSGLDARLTDANGRIPQDRRPERKTVITTGVRLVLDDAFARRSFAPVQHLRFDEVIPEQERITDITTALSDGGFTVQQVAGAASSPERCLLYATKSEGPDVMALWLFILGKRYEIQRETQMLDGQTFTANIDTGELRLFMGGTLARNSRELTHEMNALQQRLRTRFRSMRTGLT